MTVNITITSDNAEDALSDLAKLSAALNRPRVEWRVAALDARPESDVRMAASAPEEDEPIAVATDASAEEKPSRKRRTKAEMEAARRAGEPPQDGDPALDPEDTEPLDPAKVPLTYSGSETSVIDQTEDALNSAAPTDILDDEPAVHVPTREETSKLMLTVLNNKWRSAAQLKALFAEIGGESVTNLTTMADPFIPVAYERMAAITGPLHQ